MRKKLTLPSGATCVARKLTAGDFALHAGYIPQAYIAEAKTGRKPNVVSDDPEKLAEMVRVGHIIMLECISPLTMPDGRRFKVVDCDMDKAKENELTIGEMEQADAECIIREVTEMTSLTKEAAETARPFPEKQGDAGQPAPAGENLRMPSDGPAQTSG